MAHGGGGFDLASWTASDHVDPVATNLALGASDLSLGGLCGAGVNGLGSFSLVENPLGVVHPLGGPYGLPGGTDGADGLGKKEVEGDWACVECQNVNFAKRTRCNKCGASKPKSGDPLADVPHFGGPPGLFKKGDWPCAHCGNVNWARRDKCNICNASKPTNKEEPRTGRAGGHFDLQDPGDRNDYDSDNEEFDEFGRRKKRAARRTSTSPSGSTGSRRLNTSPGPVVNALHVENLVPSAPEAMGSIDLPTPPVENPALTIFPPAPPQFRKSSVDSTASVGEPLTAVVSDLKGDCKRGYSRRELEARQLAVGITGVEAEEDDEEGDASRVGSTTLSGDGVPSLMKLAFPPAPPSFNTSRFAAPLKERERITSTRSDSPTPQNSLPSIRRDGSGNAVESKAPHRKEGTRSVEVDGRRRPRRRSRDDARRKSTSLSRDRSEALEATVNSTSDETDIEEEGDRHRRNRRDDRSVKRKSESRRDGGIAVLRSLSLERNCDGGESMNQTATSSKRRDRSRSPLISRAS